MTARERETKRRRRDRQLEREHAWRAWVLGYDPHAPRVFMDDESFLRAPSFTDDTLKLGRQFIRECAIRPSLIPAWDAWLRRLLFRDPLASEDTWPFEDAIPAIPGVNTHKTPYK